jgi:DNA-binding transcriptional ArsR family regulator
MIEQFSLEDMRNNADSAVNLLRTLAHEDRLILLCQLSQQEMCVSELEQQLDIRQPSLSQQLGVLRREGLVLTRREGKHIYYQVKPGPALELLNALHALYCSKTAGINAKSVVPAPAFS